MHSLSQHLESFFANLGPLLPRSLPQPGPPVNQSLPTLGRLLTNLFPP